jgi:hypothetical protein
LECNASCGVGAGSSSDFILKLAEQTTIDFFKILLGNFLIPSTTGLDSTKEPDELNELDDTVGPLLNIIPATVGEHIGELLRNPSLALLPNPGKFSYLIMPVFLLAYYSRKKLSMLL